MSQIILIGFKKCWEPFYILEKFRIHRFHAVSSIKYMKQNYIITQSGWIIIYYLHIKVRLSCFFLLLILYHVLDTLTVMKTNH